MSDYYRDSESVLRERLAALPLFSAAAATEDARQFHERDEAQANVLTALRAGDAMTKKAYEATVRNGSRLAPVIEQLRNAHGFAISGNGSLKKPYRLDDVRQRPTLARVTPEMKSAYYSLDHWRRMKSQRAARDSNRCVVCHLSEDLRCHHLSYANLFNEPLVDLLTLCDACHERVHQDGRLKFPSGVSVKYAHWIGWRSFETWLLP